MNISTSDKAIIFDCDGVLVDSEILYQQLERSALADIGLIYETEAYVTRFMGTGEANFYYEAGKDYQEKFGRALPDDFQSQLKAKIKSEFALKLKAIEGIPAMLEGLKGRTIAVASSSELDFLKTKLTQTKLAQYFNQHIYSAQQVANAKPHPDLFLFAAEKLGFAPQDCIVIEDSENGVKAGLAAGMTTIGFTGGGHSDAAYGEKLCALGAHGIAHDARELAQLLNI